MNGTENASSVGTAIRPLTQSSLATDPTKKFTAKPATERNGDLMDMDLLAGRDSFRQMASRKLTYPY